MIDQSASHGDREEMTWEELNECLVSETATPVQRLTQRSDFQPSFEAPMRGNLERKRNIPNFDTYMRNLDERLRVIRELSLRVQNEIAAERTRDTAVIPHYEPGRFN